MGESARIYTCENCPSCDKMSDSLGVCRGGLPMRSPGGIAQWPAVRLGRGVDWCAMHPLASVLPKPRQLGRAQLRQKEHEAQQKRLRDDYDLDDFRRRRSRDLPGGVLGSDFHCREVAER